MYIDNGWYGGRYILSKYCNINESEAFASIQHGHNIISDKNLGKRKISITPWLVWNKNISEICSKRGFANVIPIGSVFLYLVKIVKFKIKKSKGTLIFPLLSQPEEKNDTNYLKLITYLNKKFPPPYTISVSIDDLKKIDKKLKKIKNVKFISWGYRGDRKYLSRLIKNIKLHKKIVCIYPGSPLIYSIYLKRKVYLLNDYFLNKPKKIKKIKRSLNLNINDFKTYGLNIENLNSNNNLAIVKKMLGEEHLKTPNELLNLLGWDNPFKKILAKILCMIINIKEDFLNGLNHSKKRRLGRDYK